ncbi:MAG: 5-bromo-4-chloroindolyl phosphate hydrolysis family protein [Clostridiales bacterium]|nr:5-bromo-4-chloroindolyl phosphate hydrolysis family protein [Clostridiales bacterium]
MSNQSRKDRIRRGKKAGSMAFGITLAVYFLFFHLGGFGGLIAGFFLAGLVSSIVRSMASGLDLKANNNQNKERQERAARPVSEVPVRKTGDSEVDSVLEKGYRTLQQIREENLKIPDALLTDKLNQLEILCGEIFRTVHDKPEKAPQIRKFMEYYLPTTLKIVSTYRVISERGVFGREMAQAKKRIEDALGTVITGCQKLLSKLYQDDVLDITTDIDVLEQMLKRDGLTETELQLAAEQARRAAEINAAVDRQERAAAPLEEQWQEQEQQTGAAANGSQAQQMKQ